MNWGQCLPLHAQYNLPAVRLEGIYTLRCAFIVHRIPSMSGGHRKISGLVRDGGSVGSSQRRELLAFAGSFLMVLLLAVPAQSGQTNDDAGRRIQALLHAGDLEAARKELEADIKAAPKDADLYNLQGVVLVQQGDTAGAEKSFKTSIALAPRYLAAYSNLARLYQVISKDHPEARAQALDTYERALKIDPADPEANYQAGVLLFQKGSYRSSLDRLARLPGPDQEHAPVLSLVCGDWAGQGDPRRAAAAADKLGKSADLAESDVLDILPVLAKAENRPLAAKLLEALQARGLAGGDSLRALGLVYEQDGKLDSARSTLEKAAQLKPNSVPVLISLAEVADRQHDYQGALEYLAHARDLEPKNAAIHFFWGIVCIEQNLGMEAYQSLRKAVSLDPENAYYNYALGAVAMQFATAAESVGYFQQYCRLRPDDPRGRLALATAYFGSHDDAKSRPLLAGITQFPATAAAAHYYLGRIASRAGDYDDAVRELESALKASPQYADAYAALGQIHMQRNEYPQAEEALQKALNISPQSYTANLNLLMLYQRTKDPRLGEQTKRFEAVKEESARKTAENLRAMEVQPVYSAD